MPNFLIQPSFSGGEFSPSLYSRVDVQKYGTGLRKAKNFIIHPHGGASNRPGLKYIGTTKHQTKKVRLIPFEAALDQSYAIEAGEYYFRFIYQDGVILSGGSPLEIVTPYSENDLPKLKWVQSNDVLYIVHPNYKPKVLTRLGHTNWTFEDLALVNGPFLSEKNKTNSLSISGSGAWEGDSRTITFGSSFLQAGHVGSLIKMNYSVASGFVATTFSSVSTSSLICRGKWRLYTRGTWTGSFKVERSYDNGATWEAIRTFSVTTGAEYNIDDYGEQSDICLIRLTKISIDSGTVNATLSVDAFEDYGIVKINSITSGTVASVTVTRTFPAVGQCKSFQVGSFSELNGYPSCAIFYQDRLLFASTIKEPQSVWFSQTSNYLDFSVSVPLKDTDAISLNLPSRKMNVIRNIVPLKDILVMTSSSEWKIGASGGVLTPSTVTQNLQENIGSSICDPIIVGHKAVFITPMGTIVRDISYDFSADGFVGSNLSIFSSHLYEEHSIKELCFQQEPDSIVWLVRDDGKLLSMTYMKEQDVLAHTWHETDGNFESCCSIVGSGQNDVYFIVNRNGKRLIEKFGKRLIDSNPSNCFFVDSGLTYNGAPTSTLSGLSHLEGKQVSILADGYVLPRKTVSSGSVNLGASYSVVQIGLPYESDFETLNVEIQLQDGVSYSRAMKVSEVKYSFLQSRGGKIGGSENNLSEIIQTDGTNLGSPIALFTGEYKQSIDSSYEEGGRVFFRQSDPLPVTILAIMPKITVGG